MFSAGVLFSAAEVFPVSGLDDASIFSVRSLRLKSGGVGLCGVALLGRGWSEVWMVSGLYGDCCGVWGESGMLGLLL